jgi:hypothetical protein
MSMKPASLLVLSTLVCLTAACSKPEPAQPAAADTPKPVAAEPAPAAEPVPAAPTLPVLRLLSDDQRAEVVVADTAHCNLESADGQAFAADDLSLVTPDAGKASGWLRASDDAATPESPVLRFESEDKTRMWEVPVALTLPRDDLTPAGGTPGFSVEFDAGALPAGRYHLYLAYRLGGTLHGCDNGRHVKVL